MAAGDVTLSLSIDGGDTKTVILTSATRQKSKLSTAITEDGYWAIFEINKMASVITSQANSQLASETTFTPVTFTAAT
jgi:hypothetical protein